MSRLIDANILINKVKQEASNDLNWKEANRMIDLIMSTPVITEVIPKPKKKQGDVADE